MPRPLALEFPAIDMTPALWALLAVAAVFDLRTRRIPNALVAVGLSLGLLSQFLTTGWTGVGHGLAAALCCLGALIAPFAQKKLGGGDVKLAMVVGVWTSVSLALSVVIFTALLTGAIAALLLLYLYFKPDTPPPKVPVAVPLFLTTIGVTAGHLPNLLLGG